ncbi:MAG: lectin like domain-containing protein [Candidatus Ancillula trichonymphae]|nr:lectin like domain-containing protein [Candidatus Ancillula trichonymphae]
MELQNSRGNGSSTNSFYYLSYYDTAISEITSHTAQAKNLYDIAQYHDYTGHLGNDVILDSSAKSVFEANKYKSPDYNTNLTEVGIQTSTPNETDVISIYVNNSPYPSSVATTSQDFTGFHVVKLPLPVNLQPNTKYSVGVKNETKLEI